MQSRRLFVSGVGYLGVVLTAASVGDVVAVVKGGRTPFVLRLCGGDEGARDSGGDGGIEGKYRTAGKCYLHGLMDSEALGREDFGWEEVWWY